MQKRGLFTAALLCFLFAQSNQISEAPEDAVEFGVPTLVLDTLQLTLSSNLLLDIYSPMGNILKGYLGWFPKRSNVSYVSCSDDNSQAGTICLKYGKNTRLSIMQESSEHCEEDTMTCHSISCYKIRWENHIGGVADCFILGDDYWYGGGETISQRWPLQYDSRSWYPAATGDPLHHSTGNVIENLWISSGGFAIFVDHNVPLFISFNESGSGKFCFSTSTKKHPYQNFGKSTKKELAYSICTGPSIKDIHKYSLRQWMKKPKDIPDEDILENPIWSTWAKYKRDISEEKVFDFVRKIELENLPISQIEIDDKWESCYGDMEFDLQKFPNAQFMIDELKENDIPVTLWVHPFCDPECKTYDVGKEKGYWIKDKDGNPVDVKWWNGDNSAMLDTTNKDAVEWFTERLRSLQNFYGVESFKFDAGEVQWLQTDFVFENAEANHQPNLYSREYSRMAASFGKRTEVRVGYETQELPIFVRMFDKFSHWDYSNGLQTLIPTALQMSLLGYRFILPDMVGGNNYTPINGSLPSRELYIRWLQANVFLPAIQFSIAPFDYDDEVLQISKKMLSLREKYWSYILNTAHHTAKTGDPFIRPLWWIAPDDSVALASDSQFLVGEGFMVAPILEEGATSRHIYLPEGKWADVQRGKTYEGSRWLYDYEAPLNYLPYFIRQS